MPARAARTHWALGPCGALPWALPLALGPPLGPPLCRGGASPPFKGRGDTPPFENVHCTFHLLKGGTPPLLYLSEHVLCTDFNMYYVQILACLMYRFYYVLCADFGTSYV